MTDTALSHALVPPLDHGTKKTERHLFSLYEQTPVASCFYALLCHYLCETATGYFLWYNGAVPLDSCTSRTVATPSPPPPPPQKKKKQKKMKFVLRSVKNANFWQKYEIILPRKNLPIWDPNLPQRNPKSPYLALRKYHMYVFSNSPWRPSWIVNLHIYEIVPFRDHCDQIWTKYIHVFSRYWHLSKIGLVNTK